VRTYAPLRFVGLADGLIVFLILLCRVSAMGIGFTLKPLPHQNFDEMCDGIQKNKSTVHDEIFGGRAYTLQNNRALSQATAGYKTAKNQTVTWKNFAMKRLGVAKNLTVYA
jgi:hypothetical protein